MAKIKKRSDRKTISLRDLFSDFSMLTKTFVMIRFRGRNYFDEYMKQNIYARAFISHPSSHLV